MNKKRILKVVIASVVAMLTIFLSTGCGGNTVSVQYGKKYANYRGFYVFSSDGTGYYEEHFVGTYGGVWSGRADFVWKTASDGMVYLFQTKVEYFDDNTDGNYVSATTLPLAFGKDFFAYTSSDGYVGTVGGSVSSKGSRYVVEGSDLDKKLNE